MQFYKKGGLGILVEQDRKDSDSVEVRMTTTEYIKIQNEISYLERENDKKDKQLASKEKELQEKNNKIEGLEDKAEELKKKIDTLQDDVEKLEVERSEWIEEYEIQCDFNRNALRIIKEMKNVQHGLRPKKEKDGYFPVKSKEYREIAKYKLKNEEYEAECLKKAGTDSKKQTKWKENNPQPYWTTVPTMVWKTVIQTPYDAYLPMTEVLRNQIADIDLWDIGVAKALGCENMNENEANGDLVAGSLNGDKGTENLLYKWEFEADYIHECWNVIIYTTHPLNVPRSRKWQRPRRKNMYTREDAERGVPVPKEKLKADPAEDPEQFFVSESINADEMWDIDFDIEDDDEPEV